MSAPVRVTPRAEPEPREPIDLRLAVGAVAAWLSVLFCVDGPPGRALLLAAGAAGAAVAVVVGLRRWRGGPALALTLFCVALALLPLAGRIAHARASPLTALAGEHARVTMELTVSDDPRLLSARGLAGTPRVAVETSADAVLTDGRRTPVDGSVLVLADAPPWANLLPGQRVRLDGSLRSSLDGGYLSVTLFARSAPVRIGAPPWWQRVAGRIRAALRQAAAVLPDQERGLLPGLVDGDTTNLDPVLAERFKLAGLTHLVAVSGTNCSIVVGVVLLVLRRVRSRPWISALAGGLVLVMFVVVARPSPSVLRAALMAAIALVSLASGRPRAAVPGLAAAVLLLLLWDPTLAASVSFVLSVTATAALLVLAPGWARALRRRRVPVGIAESVAVAAAAHLVTAPVVAAISGKVSLVAVAANVLAEPVVAPVTVLGFAAAVTAPLWLPGGTALVWLAGWPCRWLVAVAERFGSLHGATVPWPGGATGGLLLLMLLIALGLAAQRIGPRRVIAAAASTALIVFIPVRGVTSGWPPEGWSFVACDIGQGDALVLRAAAGAAVVIDTGPEPVPVDRCLHDLDVERIPLLVLTHLHVDHIGGLPGVLRGRWVGRVITGPSDEPAAGSAIVHDALRARGLSLTTPAVGTRFDTGDVHVEVLAPASAYRGTRSDPNNSSLVLRAEVGGVRILLAADEEIEAQRDLVASGADLRADVLKVPHHGSAYFDPDFLAAVHASVGVISVGAHNDYGHPAPRLLTALARLGIPVLRTDRNGDIAVAGGSGHVHAVARGRAVTSVGLGHRGPVAGVWPGHQRPVALAVAVAKPRRAASSAVGARMAVCRPDRSASTTSPTPSRAPCCWSATRNCWSSGPSARSPPPPGGRIQAYRRSR